MREILICAVMLAVLLGIFTVFGVCFFRLIRGKTESLTLTILTGFFFYQLLFFAADIPLKVKLMPLSYLTILWCVVVAAVLILGILFCRKEIKQLFHTKRLRAHPYLYGAILLLVLLQLVLINWNTHISSVWDAAYYVGDVASSVHTDTISQYSPYSGEKMSQLMEEYLLESFENHSAVLCRIFGLSPLVAVRTGMASLVVLLNQMIYYQIGMHLFQKDRKKTAEFLAFFFVLQFFSYNTFSAAGFYFLRPFEGKAVQAVLIFPMMFLAFVRIAQDYERKEGWYLMFLVICASYGLNMSSVFLVPLQAGGYLGALFCTKRKAVIWKRAVLCLLPCVVMAGVYLLTKKVWLITIP